MSATTAIEVKERPILFSAPMVRAILEGRKTQTRRVMKPQPEEVMDGGRVIGHRLPGNVSYPAGLKHPNSSLLVQQHTLPKCPHGQHGDRLWVRETFQVRYYETLKSAVIWYAADGKVKTVPEMTSHCDAEDVDNYVRKYLNRAPRPSIFMPRWASRISLEIVKVRVERVQDITEADAAAEGWTKQPERSDDPEVHRDAARDWYQDLWNEINSERGHGWNVNDWVWVIEFKRLV